MVSDNKPTPIAAPDAVSADDDVIHEKLIDAMTPGFEAEFDPDEAERAGAFVEDALSESDAIQSSIDLVKAATPTSDGAR